MTDTVPARKPPPMSQEAWDKLPEEYKPVFAAAYSSKSDTLFGQAAEKFFQEMEREYCVTNLRGPY